MEENVSIGNVDKPNVPSAPSAPSANVQNANVQNVNKPNVNDRVECYSFLKSVISTKNEILIMRYSKYDLEMVYRKYELLH